MPDGFDSRMMSPWEEDGRLQAGALDEVGFVLVLGDDPVAAAEAALGMARGQARRRRVVVADAVGSLGPIDDLVPVDSPFGISDVFGKGMPLDQALHAVDSAQNLNVLPSGGATLDPADLMANERWMQIADEFRAAGALLLVVVPTNEAAVDFLSPQVDGAVLVGRAQPLVGVRVLAYVSGQPVSASMETPRRSTSVSSVPREGPSGPRVTGYPAIPRTSEVSGRRTAPKSRAGWWIAALLAVALAGAGTGWWLVTHGRAPRTAAVAPATAIAHSDSQAAADSTIANDSAGSVPVALPVGPPAVAPVAAPSTAPAPDSGAAAKRSAALEAMLAQARAAAADSNAKSAAYSVELDVLASATAANARLEAEPIRDLPAITISPMAEPDGSHSFHVLAGAYNDRGGADSLLGALVKDGVVIKGQGKVVRLPFTVVVQSGITRDEASLLATGYRSKGFPVYALALPDGRMRMYVGAFERAADAALLVATLRSNNETPSVTYRIGRLP
jgi:hypothetical protein